MRTIKVKVYKFDELDEKAKVKARDWYREGALTHDWWDFTYDSFRDLAAYFGFEVDLKRTYFRGFCSQGDGSSFEADVDIVKMFNCIKEQKWKEDFTTLELRFLPITRNMERVVQAASKKYLSVSGSVANANRETSVRANLDWNLEDPSGMKSYDRIDEVMREIEDFLQDVAETLNNHLYRSLEREHDWQLADEQVDESIKSNDYEFTKDGKRYLQISVAGI